MSILQIFFRTSTNTVCILHILDNDDKLFKKVNLWHSFNLSIISARFAKGRKVLLENIWMMAEESSRCVFHVQNMPIVEPIEGLNEETKSLV